jgi:hypothetical protein
MRALALALAVAASGCATKQTRTSWHNAPGLVDLSAPPPRDRGDAEPDAFVAPEEPGTATLAVIPMPNVLFGTGRGNPGSLAIDLGFEMRFEYHASAKRQPFAKKALAFTAGLASLQVVDRGPNDFGGMFGELNYRFALGGIVPMDVGVGPVVYPTNFEVGGQVTVRLPLIAIRLRYVEQSGFEFWGGYQIAIPFLFQRSR